MTRFLSAFAIVALAATVVAEQRRADYDTERVSRTVKLGSGGTLRLKNFSGRVSITGADRSDVAIDAVRSAPRERLERIKLDIHTDGSTLVIDANHYDRSWFDWSSRNNVVETEFTIRVPARTNLDVSVFSSPVEIVGVEGSHKVHAFSAKLRLEDVSGPVQAHTFSGPVEIRTSSWGDDRTIDVDTFSGNINVHVPESAHADVSFRSFSGRLTSDMPMTLRSGSRKSLSATLGGDARGGRLRFKTFSGNVRIDR